MSSFSLWFVNDTRSKNKTNQNKTKSKQNKTKNRNQSFLHHSCAFLYRLTDLERVRWIVDISLSPKNSQHFTHEYWILNEKRIICEIFWSRKWVLSELSNFPFKNGKIRMNQVSLEHIHVFVLTLIGVSQFHFSKYYSLYHLVSIFVFVVCHYIS